LSPERLARRQSRPVLHCAVSRATCRPAEVQDGLAAKPEIAGRLRSIAEIVIIDVAAPLIAYSLLRSAAMSSVTALVPRGTGACGPVRPGLPGLAEDAAPESIGSAALPGHGLHVAGAH
jgi:hypothetical protein